MREIQDTKPVKKWVYFSGIHGMLLADREMAEKENRQVLEIGSWISMLLLGSMIVIAPELSGYHMLLIYCAFTAVSLLAVSLCLFVMPAFPMKYSSLPFLYVSLVLMSLLSVCITISDGPRTGIPVFLGCLLFFPLIILDEPYRITIFMLLMSGIYFFLLDVLLHPAGILEDITSCGGIMLCSLVFGRSIAGLRLENMDNKRILQQNKLQMLQNESRYTKAMKAAGLFVWEFDTAGRRIFLPAEQDSEYIGQQGGIKGNVIENVPDVFYGNCETQEDVDTLRRIYADISHGAEYTGGIVWYRRTRDSHPECYRIHYFVRCDEKGIPVAAFGSGQDITAQEMEKKRYSEALRNMIHANPRAMNIARLDLTANICCEGHGATESIIRKMPGSTVDALFDQIAGLISVEEDRAGFREVFDRKTLLRSFERGVLHGSASYRREIRRGTVRWIKTYLNMVRNPENGHVEALIFAEDIDEIKKGEQMIQLITDEEFDYISLLYVPEQKYVFYHISKNIRSDFESFPFQTGEPAEYGEVCRNAAQKWIHEEEQERFLRETGLDYIREQLDRKHAFSERYRGRKEDKTACWKQIKMTYLDELRDWIMLEQTDITREAGMQDMLENQLGRERELRQMADRANEMKTGFLASVSHDMRTPLNAVLGYAALAQEAGSLEQMKEYLSKIQTAGSTLLLLINDTLDLQKMESGMITLKTEPVNIADMTESVATALRPDMDRKQITFKEKTEYRYDGYVSADLVMLEKVLINLLSNAVKYTPESGTVSFSAQTAAADNGEVAFHAVIRDTGYGISREFLPRIYEPFSREYTEKTEHIEGSGLGLAIVKRLVDLMGGSIAVLSEPGQGTEFRVDLKFPESAGKPEKDSPAEKREETDMTGVKILLCEDNPMNQEIMEAILRRYGMEVVCAGDGRTGAELFENSGPGEYQAILMDVRMPVMDGYQATERIRNADHPDAGKIPVIAMTADAYQEDIQKALSSGMNAHIAKPVNVKQLYAELKKQMHL